MKQFVFYLAEKFHRIVVFYIGSIVVASLLLMWIEDKPFDLMMWYTCVTALTIGYGDVTATTICGRIVTMLFAHLWIFGIAPLVVANVLNALLENRDRFSHEEQEEIKRQLQQILALHHSMAQQRNTTEPSDLGKIA